MTRPAKHLAISYLIVLAGIAILMLRPTPQPGCDGKPLRYWLRRQAWGAFNGRYVFYIEGRDAVREIGTNALPFLIKGVQKDSLRAITRRLLSKWPGNLAQKIRTTWFDPVDDPATQALAGFESLGPAASSAIPELRAIMNGPARPGDSPAARANAGRALDLILTPRAANDIQAR